MLQTATKDLTVVQTSVAKHTNTQQLQFFRSSVAIGLCTEPDGHPETKLSCSCRGRAMEV